VLQYYEAGTRVNREMDGLFIEAQNGAHRLMIYTLVVWLFFFMPPTESFSFLHGHR